MKSINLNNSGIEGQGALIDHSTTINNPNFDMVSVVFKDLEIRIIELIKEFKDGVIFGNVAWLTSEPILNALANCSNVQIVVQKEDFLRPDLGASNSISWKRKLESLYTKLQFGFDRYLCQDPMGSLSFASSTNVDPIRCVGNYNHEKKSAFPRAHNKFLVFCKVFKREDNKLKDDERDFDFRINYKPVVVWTGSFNFTYNATQSFENAIILRDNSGDNEILKAFLKEHHQIFALSEPLKWSAIWSEPEYRIGT